VIIKVGGERCRLVSVDRMCQKRAGRTIIRSVGYISYGNDHDTRETSGLAFHRALTYGFSRPVFVD
jgi:hypothetical protein